MSLQPLKEDALPAYLRPDPTSPLRPPVMRYGWRIDHTQAMEIVAENFPRAVIKTRGPDTFSADYDEDYEYTYEEYAIKRPDTCLTLTGILLQFAICWHFRITDGSLFCVTTFYDEMGRDYFGISIGTNYQGTVEPSQRDGIQAMFVPHIEPMWYLDSQYWHWRRVAKKQSSKHPQHAKSTAAADSSAISAYPR